MKRIVSALLAAALFFTLQGCGNGDAAAENETNSAASAAATTEAVPAAESPSAAEATPDEVTVLNYVVHEYGESDTIVNYSDNFNSTIHFPVMGIAQVDQEIRGWAEAVSQSAMEAAEAGRARGESGNYEYSASLEYSYNAYLVKNRFVGVEELGFWEESDAAHPEEPVRTFNVDLAGGELLDSETLFYYNKREDVLTMLDSALTAMGYGDSLDRSALGECWLDNVLLRSQGVDFLFEAGSIVPGAEGLIRVQLGYGDLARTMTLGEIMQQNTDATPDPALVNPPVILVEGEGTTGASQSQTPPATPEGESPANTDSPPQAPALPEEGQPAGSSPAADGQGTEGGGNVSNGADDGEVLTDSDGVPYAMGPRRELDPNAPMVALTFDDGPSRNTPIILELFEEYGGRGTFFVVGNRVQQYASIVQQIVDQGSEIANHTWNHKKLTSLSKREVREEIQGVIDVVESITGSRPRFVRPPYGAADDSVKAVGADMDVAFVNWNIDTLDWKTRDAKATYNAIMADIADGCIILCHDLHDATGEAMKLVIPELARQGYQMVTVSELFEAKGIEVEAGTMYRHAEG